MRVTLKTRPEMTLAGSRLVHFTLRATVCRDRTPTVGKCQLRGRLNSRHPTSNVFARHRGDCAWLA